ncbi:conserved hypothetical protein [Solidesulfovibrio fructosivorans JJ]]|uniref:Coenzyme PQQ synthesis D n=1 Tax=Solidesulfovibrio fructosivorans JJ] TaxID=596151 RepID=E1JVY8_SOLFR|nr:PqqD family protein [Solidesulfovibrio fructosivorans]EFL51626.1 conserved hypothetical protein [Solidesulfovibrio fructosivorans JJ]]
MSLFKKKPLPPDAGGLTRRQAMELAPVVSRDVRAEEIPSGVVQLSLPVAVRPALAGLARRFGLWDGKPLRKTVELDAMGSAVWRLIDGKRSAGEIAAELARRYNLDAREAEMAVAEFLRLLGRRGAIAVVGREGEEE